MSAPKTQTLERQEQIVQAALELMNDCGVTGLSIAGIAEKVGIVPSALYRHFTSKDAVLDAVLDLIRDRLLDNVAHAREKTPVPLKQLNLLFTRHIAMLSENRAIPHVVFPMLYTMDSLTGKPKSHRLSPLTSKRLNSSLNPGVRTAPSANQ